MLINADVKSLEIYTAADLADDKVLKEELLQKQDTHQLNQDRFKLPSRVVAKRFIFKLLYGATAYGYSMDSDFLDVGFSVKQWQWVIDEFYEKYFGIKKWHDRLLETVKQQGYIEIPSGRFYQFEPTYKNGDWKWPLTTIKNYPVQGFGADLVKLARVEFFKTLLRSGLDAKFISTVHDSLVSDAREEDVLVVAKMMNDAVEKVPALCREYFQYDFSLPLLCEIQVGPNKYDMKPLTLG